MKSFKGNKILNLVGFYCFNIIIAVESNLNLSVVLLLLLKAGTPDNRDGFINCCPSLAVHRVIRVVLQCQKKKKDFWTNYINFIYT